MAKSIASMKFIAQALFLTFLLLVAVWMSIGSRVLEGMEQSDDKKPADSADAAKEAVDKAVSTPGEEPKPAEAHEQAPSTQCSADSCVYIPGSVGKAAPSAGEGYTISNCGPLMVAHKEGKEKSCSLAMMSHAIAGVCAKHTKDGKWCNLTDAQKDSWIPMPEGSIDVEGLAKMASEVKA